MPCTAQVPNLTAREQAQFIHDAIPPGLFRTDDDSERIPWRVSPEPFALSEKSVATIEQIGRDLLAFYRALNSLYNLSSRGTAPDIIAEYLYHGKAESFPARYPRRHSSGSLDDRYRVRRVRTR